ncbi:hypothetical protein LTR66_001467 [Elasticomyces elasticus]|nr:hypothetical protein LTR66_001467 [Elasticomyces elasticus]
MLIVLLRPSRRQLHLHPRLHVQPQPSTPSKQAQEKFQQLREAYPGSRLLIVSNSAGTLSDPGSREAELVERNTGVKVLRHTTKKPGCRSEILSYFRDAPDSGVTSASQIAVVGDRLFTDVVLANLMGSHSVWVRDGVVEDKGLLPRFEKYLAGFLLRRGYVPPNPKSSFE